MKPVNYNELTVSQRRAVREEYIKAQSGKCQYCGEPLSGPPSQEVEGKCINAQLFPQNFFNHPIHLHHNHITGMTIGAIHCKCNAVLWQYYGN